jgi:hypothetical protein
MVRRDASKLEPVFGIAQRALLVPAAAGNVLWDCISLIDPTWSTSSWGWAD